MSGTVAGSRSPSRARRRMLGAGAGLSAGAAVGVAGHLPAMAATPAAAPAPERFAFAVLGDIPYSTLEERRLQQILAELDADRLACVIHVGDIKGGREPCSDELLARRKALLAQSAHPMVVLHGDNEWTDCHRPAAGGYDPPERLRHLRRLFHDSGTSLGGRALALERQPQMPENVRWRIGAVQFVTLHVVGSGNGRDGYPGSRAEWSTRNELNGQWLRSSVDRSLASGIDALVLAAHADPDFGETPKPGFADFVGQLREACRRFAGQVLFLHGDSHRFRADQPLEDEAGRTVRTFTRVETFGSPFTSSWVRIRYDPDLAQRFFVTTRELSN